MIAPTRPRVADSSADIASIDSALNHWRRAVDIRDEWLAHGLATEPADRSVAEDNLATIYAGLGRPRPIFRWVDSPRAALPHLHGLPSHDDLYAWVTGHPPGPRPLASDLAAGLSRLRSSLADSITKPDFDPSRKPAKDRPRLPPTAALAAGAPFREVVREGVRDELAARLLERFVWPVRTALRQPIPICWYGQQNAHWIAFYDVWRRLGLTRYLSADEQQLDAWATLARTCGWWWPGEDMCVVVERPVAVLGEEILYRDGWRVSRTASR